MVRDIQENFPGFVAQGFLDKLQMKMGTDRAAFHICIRLVFTSPASRTMIIL